MSKAQNLAMRRNILPFFIPMQGCQQHCIYCDQWSISGSKQPPNPAEIRAVLLAQNPAQPLQVAFYGGSFSALPLAEQKAYLEAVQPAMQAGQVDSIRVSTRPEAISTEKLQFLAAYGVRVIELGVQSFAAAVLKAAGRSYCPVEAIKACQLINKAGLGLGIQLMTGLPQDDAQKSLSSMLEACRLQPQIIRIYPTLVLRGTPLANLYTAGGYQPQSLVAAAELAAEMLMIAKAHDIPVARLGLDAAADLEQALVAGPYHPAFGELAYGALKRQQAQELLGRTIKPTKLLFPPREHSLLFGHQRLQVRALQADYPGLVLQAAPELSAGSLASIAGCGDQQELTVDEFAKQRLAKLLLAAGQKTLHSTCAH